MDKLIALDGHVAFYEHNEEPSPGFDAFESLYDLLSIRGAYSAVEYLYKHPSCFAPTDHIYAMVSMDGQYETWNPQIEPCYSERALERAIEKLNKKFRSSVQLIKDGHHDFSGFVTAKQSDAYLESIEGQLYEISKQLWDNPSNEQWDELFHQRERLVSPGRETLKCIQIGALLGARDSLAEIIGLAAIANGIIPLYDSQLKFDYKIYEKSNEAGIKYKPQKGKKGGLRYGAFIFDGNDLFGLLPHEYPIKITDVDVIGRLEEITMLIGVVDVDVSERENTITLIAHEGQTNWREIAGVLAAWLLNEWRLYYSTKNIVTFNQYDGFVNEPGYDNDVIRELQNCIIENRIGICPVCGRPLVGKRRKAEGGISRETCTRSCKAAKAKQGKAASND